MNAHNEFKNELESLYDELDQVQAMSEEAFAAKYDGKDKEEYIEDLKSEINYLEPSEDEVEEVYDDWDDHGFRDQSDYNNYRFGNAIFW